MTIVWVMVIILLFGFVLFYEHKDEGKNWPRFPSTPKPDNPPKGQRSKYSTMVENLQPCPFCGSLAIREQSDYVSCSNKDCLVIPLPLAIWNKRATPPFPEPIWIRDGIDFTHPLKEDESILEQDDGTYEILWSCGITDCRTLREAQGCITDNLKKQWARIHSN